MRISFSWLLQAFFLSQKGSRRSKYGGRCGNAAAQQFTLFCIAVVFLVRLGPLGSSGHKLPTLTLPENILGHFWLAMCLQYLKTQKYRRPVYRPKVVLGTLLVILYRLWLENNNLGNSGDFFFFS